MNTEHLFKTSSALLLTCSLAVPAMAGNDRPNIVMILIDDMGWKDVGYAGSKYYETPNIDQLSEEGLVFYNAYSAAPVSTPSRGALFSGKCPARTKLTTVFVGPSGPDDRLHKKSKYTGVNDQHFEALNRHALTSTETILPQPLKECGYTTGIFGKWHIGECEGYYPDQRGFDVAKGYRKLHGVRYGHWGKQWIPNNFANLPGPEPDEFIAETLTDECIKFMKENKDRPYFAVLSHYIVHIPIRPRLEKVTRYERRQKSDQYCPEYAALVESVDESVGRVLNTIKELGQEDNTIVIFTSDNGGLTLPGATCNYPLMGGKSFPFEAGMKVPLIIRWPEKIKPGVTYDRTVNMDLYPTLLCAAGHELMPEQHVDGVNLMPLLTQGEKLDKKRPIVFHYPHYTHAVGPFSSIIENDWKLIHFYNDDEGAYLLYNLADDPEEQHNLAGSEPARTKYLAGHLDRMLKEMDAEMPIKNPDYRYDENNEELFTLKFTLEMAEKERREAEERLGIRQKTDKPDIE